MLGFEKGLLVMREFIRGWQRKLGFLILLLFLAVLLGWWASFDFSRVEEGENVRSVNWLPGSASNVSFFKSYLYTAYEFDIPEPEFIKWSGWKLTTITQPVHVSRYCFFKVNTLPSPAPNATNEEWEAFEKTRSTAIATITNGLYFEYLHGNGGGVRVAYDRDRGRAFFWSSPR